MELPLHLYLLIGLTVTCASAVVWSVLGATRGDVRARLEAINARQTGVGGASSENVSVITDDTPRSLGERVLISLGTKQANKQGRDSLRATLRHAGFRRPSALPILLGIRVVLMVGFPMLTSAFVMPMLGDDPTTAMLGLGAAAGLGYMLPAFAVKQLAAKRQVAINAALPDVLDLLVLCMEAGLGLNAAITRVAEERSGGGDILGNEFERLANELRVGVPRKDALQNLADRVGSGDLRTVVAQLIHTERLGGNVGPALRAQSESVRAARRLRTEEIANQMPVKMLLPTLVFVIPLFIILFAPVFISVMKTLGWE
jgi:tight adherence protein C